MLNHKEMNVIELQKVGAPTVAGIKAIMNRFGSAYGKRVEGKGAAERMLENFAANGLVRAEPAIFGASLSVIAKPAQRINPLKETLKGFAAKGVVRQEIMPFGVLISQVVA